MTCLARLTLDDGANGVAPGNVARMKALSPINGRVIFFLDAIAANQFPWRGNSVDHRPESGAATAGMGAGMPIFSSSVRN
jgi:hypothetical protein